MNVSCWIFWVGNDGDDLFDDIDNEYQLAIVLAEGDKLLRVDWLTLLLLRKGRLY